MKGDDRSEGVNPHFASFVGSLLDADVPLQTVHYARRGARRGACGDYTGQTSPIRSAVTCPACKAARGAR